MTASTHRKTWRGSFQQHRQGGRLVKDWVCGREQHAIYEARRKEMPTSQIRSNKLLAGISDMDQEGADI